MINWDDIELKGRTTGTVKTTCPNCSHTRKKKKDPCLSVNLDKGAAKCWHCEEVSWREALEETKVYETPPQEWRNHTNLSDKLVEWFKGRGITQKTLIAAKITEEKQFIPGAGKEMNCAVFNYFEGSNLINKKYRTAQKQFSQTKNAKKTFYGLNDIVDSSEVYIVEGEMDKLAMLEAGITNCISVPNGANDLNDVFENCERYIKEVKEFIIAVDMDEPGKKLEQALIKRLGKHRCKRVHFHGKDANDDLISGKLGTSLKNPEPYPVEGTYTANDVKVDIWKLYEHGHEKPLRPKGPEWEDFNKEFSILPGQLTIVTGIPGHGKSNWLEWYILNLIHTNGLKASFFSPEHLPLADHHAQLAEKFIGRPFYNNTRSGRKMTPEELQSYQDWSSENIFLTAPEGG